MRRPSDHRSRQGTVPQAQGGPGASGVQRIRRVADSQGVKTSQVAWVIAAVVISGCEAALDPSPVDPVMEPEIVARADGFDFRAAGLTGISQRVTYTWPHSGSVAIVTQSSTVVSGAATLTVRDSAGLAVYARTLSVSGSFVTGRGAPGPWTIAVEASDFSGTVAFSVRSTGPSIGIDGERYPPGLPEGPIF